MAGPINKAIIISQQRQRISRNDNSVDFDKMTNIWDIRNDNDEGKKCIEFLRLSMKVQVNV